MLLRIFCSISSKAILMAANFQFLLILFGFILPHSFAMSVMEKDILREKSKEMFFHAYNNYMQHAYPADELMPLSCKGRYRGTEPSRGDIDEAMGNYSLTLIDSLDTLFLLNATEEFKNAVRLIIKDVSFDRDVTVSVFEVNIRVLGGLLGGHVAAIVLKSQGKMSWYEDELLKLAEDLGQRLLPSFNSTTGIPFPRVNLRHGLRTGRTPDDVDTCTACAGTMILEFAALSRFTGNPEFENRAQKAMNYLWDQRNRHSDLVGTVINIHTGSWVRRDSGVGAGIDSYYEYLYKAYVLLGDEMWLHRFNTHYAAIKKYISSTSFSLLPLFVDVEMHRPSTKTRNFMDSLQAFFPGLQVLLGDLKPAIALHEILHHVVQRHQFLPEAFTVDFHVHWAHHPLRPEFIESTYFLYRATGDPHYLQVGADVLENLEKYARVPCGFAAIKDVRTMAHEDQLDSYVLAETFKYLYLLFSDPRSLPISLDDYIFTTEAHLLPLSLSTLPKSAAIQHNSSSQSNHSEFNFDSSTYTVFPREITSQSRDCPNLLFESYLNKQHKVDNGKIEAIDLLLGISLAQTGSFPAPLGKGMDPLTAAMEKNCGCAAVSSRIRNPLQILLSRLYPNPKDKDSADKHSHPESGQSAAVDNTGHSFILQADAFDPHNPMHLEYLKWMGIKVLDSPDGSLKLYHSPNLASNQVMAMEGAKFMKQIIRLKDQKEREIDSRYVVLFDEPYYGRAYYRAGPSQFSPFPNGPTEKNADSIQSIADLGLVGSVIFYPGQKHLACDAQEAAKLSTEQKELIKDAIVVVRRGSCMFIHKARILNDLGAKAGIVVDDESTGISMETHGPFAMSSDGQGDVHLPFLFLFPVEGAQLYLAMENANKKGKPLQVLLTKEKYSPNLIHRLGKLATSSTSNTKETNSKLPSEKSNEEDPASSPPKDQQFVPLKWQLYSMRHLFHSVKSDTKVEAENASPGVVIVVSRVLVSERGQPVTQPQSKDTSESENPQGRLSWQINVNFNFDSFQLKAHSQSDEDLSKNQDALVNLFIGTTKFISTKIPDTLRPTFLEMLQRIFEAISQEEHHIQLRDQFSIEYLLQLLTDEQNAFPEKDNSTPNSVTHSLVIQLYCITCDLHEDSPRKPSNSPDSAFDLKEEAKKADASTIQTEDVDVRSIAEMFQNQADESEEANNHAQEREEL